MHLIKHILDQVYAWFSPMTNQESGDLPRRRKPRWWRLKASFPISNRSETDSFQRKFLHFIANFLIGGENWFLTSKPQIQRHLVFFQNAICWKKLECQSICKKVATFCNNYVCDRFTYVCTFEHQWWIFNNVFVLGSRSFNVECILNTCSRY